MRLRVDRLDVVRSRLLALVLLCLAGALLLSRSAEARPPVVTARALLGVTAVRPGDAFEAAVVLDIAKGYHINTDAPKLDFQIPTKLVLAAGEGLTWGAPHFPAPETIKLALSPDPVPVFSGRVLVRISGNAAATLATSGVRKVKVTIDYQACNDTACLAPATTDTELEIPLAAAGTPVKPAHEDELRALETAPTSSGAPSSSPRFGTASGEPTTGAPSSGGAPPPTAPPDSGAIAYALLSALLGGLLLNIMPCVFPVLSLKVAGVVEHAHSSGTPPWKHAVAFTSGVLVFCWGLAAALLGVRAAGEKAGWGFQLQSPLFVAGMALLLFIIALNLFGVFEIGVGMTRLGGVEAGSGLLGSFGSGALTTLVATPCSAPFMGSAVGIALNQPGWYTFPIFTLLGLGISLPYDLLVCVPALMRRMPRPGPWMVVFKQALAFPMLAAVVWLAWVLGVQRGPSGMAALLACQVMVALGLWGYGRAQSSLSRSAGIWRVVSLALVAGAVWWMVDGLVHKQAEAIAWQPFSPAALQKARDEKKVVFIDFTAAWCATCQTNERLVLSRREIADAFTRRGVVALRGDFTSQDPIIATALASYGRSAVPVYVVYRPGDDKPNVLPDVLTPSVVLDAIATP